MWKSKHFTRAFYTSSKTKRVVKMKNNYKHFRFHYETYNN